VNGLLCPHELEDRLRHRTCESAGVCVPVSVRARCRGLKCSESGGGDGDDVVIDVGKVNVIVIRSGDARVRHYVIRNLSAIFLLS